MGRQVLQVQRSNAQGVIAKLKAVGGGNGREVTSDAQAGADRGVVDEACELMADVAQRLQVRWPACGAATHSPPTANVMWRMLLVWACLLSCRPSES